MTTLKKPQRGMRKQQALDLLATEPMTAPQLRDAMGYEGQDGTSKTHSVLRTLVEAGWVKGEELGPKQSMNARTSSRGRSPKRRFKITRDGRKARKAME